MPQQKTINFIFAIDLQFFRTFFHPTLDGAALYPSTAERVRRRGGNKRFVTNAIEEEKSKNGNEPGKRAAIGETGDQLNQPFCESANVPVYVIWRKKCYSVSPTRCCPTLLVHTTRIYTQLQCRMLFAVCQKSSINLRVHKQL